VALAQMLAQRFGDEAAQQSLLVQTLQADAPPESLRNASVQIHENAWIIPPRTSATRRHEDAIDLARDSRAGQPPRHPAPIGSAPDREGHNQSRSDGDGRSISYAITTPRATLATTNLASRKTGWRPSHGGM
jgi:hypothetical protein